MASEAYPITIKEENGLEYILDNIRKKYVILSPEEWVRQELIKYLIEVCHYPKACFSVEKTISQNNKKFRYDIVVYKEEKPWMLIECKSPEIEITQDTFLQSSVYQNLLQAPYIMLCNGKKTVCYNVALNAWEKAMVPY